MEKEYMPLMVEDLVTPPYGEPHTLNPASLIGSIGTFSDPQLHLDTLKNLTCATDDTIAYWLNINVKTYRSYRNANAELKPDIREHLIMLKTLARHGVSVFGTSEAFGAWLNTENFMLGKLKPASLLNTNSGIRLIDDRLTGMAYGDNA